MAPGDCRYDLFAEKNGRTLRVQVKSCHVLRNGGYSFWAIKKNRYKITDFELVACVALDIKIIGFLPSAKFANKCRIYLRPPGASKARGNGFTISDYTLPKALKEIKK